MENTAQIFLIAGNNNYAVRSAKWRLERLLGNNIDVAIRHNGEDAVRLFDDMPKCSGLQAAAEIRNIERSNNISRPVAIVGTTVDFNNVIQAEFIEAGANVVLFEKESWNC